MLRYNLPTSFLTIRCEPIKSICMNNLVYLFGCGAFGFISLTHQLLYQLESTNLHDESPVFGHMCTPSYAYHL